MEEEAGCDKEHGRDSQEKGAGRRQEFGTGRKDWATREGQEVEEEEGMEKEDEGKRLKLLEESLFCDVCAYVGVGLVSFLLFWSIWSASTGSEVACLILEVQLRPSSARRSFTGSNFVNEYDLKLQLK